MLEAEVRRLGQEPVRASGRVLGEGAAAGAEHLVTRLDQRHALVDRRDASGHVKGRVHPYEHLVVPDHRSVDLPQLQDVG